MPHLFLLYPELEEPRGNIEEVSVVDRLIAIDRRADAEFVLSVDRIAKI